jgi:hypothetical protein
MSLPPFDKLRVTGLTMTPFSLPWGIEGMNGEG